MATLEKIRSKSVLLVSVIFVALFLFIITIVDNPLGLIQDQTTVAKVKNEKIDYERYQQRANQMRESNPEAESVDTQALEGLILESLFNQELGKLGIVVTDREVSDAIVGENAPMMIAYQFQQRYGASPADFYQAMNNPEAYGMEPEQAEMMRHEWIEFENNVEQMLLGQKFYSLLSGTIQANKIDAQAMQQESATTYTIAAASKNIYSSTDTLTAAEAKQYYTDHRSAYSIDEPSRYVRFVNIDVRPSAADQSAAVTAAAQAVRDLSEQPAMEGLAGNSTFTVNVASTAADELDRLNQPALKTFLTTAKLDSVAVVTNTAYATTDPKIVIAKLMGRDNRVNGATIKQIVIDPTFAPDTVIAALNSGAQLADVKGTMGEPQSVPVKFSQLPAEVADTLRAVGVGNYIALGGNGSAIAVSVESYDDPVDIYDYATATYMVEPSKTTIDNLRDRMRSFLEVASTAETFNGDNAMANGLHVEDALITPSSAAIANLSDSRGLVAWAMEAKKGAVSSMNQDSRNSRISAVAVMDIYNSDYIPMTFPQVKSAVEMLALNEKRANGLINEYAGKASNLAEYASLMGVQTDTISNVNFSANTAARYGNLAAMRAHKKGDLVGPVRWNSSVAVYEIIDARESEMPYDEEANKNNFNNRMQSLVLNDMRTLLLGNGKIDNRILRFTRQ